MKDWAKHKHNLVGFLAPPVIFTISVDFGSHLVFHFSLFISQSRSPYEAFQEQAVVRAECNSMEMCCTCADSHQTHCIYINPYCIHSIADLIVFLAACGLLLVELSFLIRQEDTNEVTFVDKHKYLHIYAGMKWSLQTFMHHRISLNSLFLLRNVFIILHICSGGFYQAINPNITVDGSSPQWYASRCYSK